MVRSIAVGFGAAVLSWVLLSLSILAWLSWTQSGHLARDAQTTTKGYAAVEKEYSDPFALLSKGKRQQEIVIFPVISIISGVLVGLLGKVRTGWIAVAALFPLQIFLLAANDFGLWAFLRAFVYFSLAYFCAGGVHTMWASHAPKGPPGGA